jgi:hypothetical protein
MSSSAVPLGGYEIHTGATIHRAYDAVFKNLHTVVDFAWLPYVLVMAAEIVGMVLGMGGYSGHMLAWMFGGLAMLVFGTSFGVRWFRYQLLGENPTGELFPAMWKSLFFAMVTVTLMVFAGGVVVTLLGMILSPIGVLITGLGYIAVAMVALRLLLMFPAAAVDRPVDVRGAWGMLEGNYWHYFACAVICYIPFALVEGIIGEIDSGAPWLLWIVLEAVRIAVMFVGLACLYAMLADVYHGITGVGRGAIASAAD